MQQHFLMDLPDSLASDLAVDKILQSIQTFNDEPTLGQPIDDEGLASDENLVSNLLQSSDYRSEDVSFDDYGGWDVSQ